MNKISFPTILLCAIISFISCKEKYLEVEITDETGVELGTRVVELPAQDILGQLNSSGFYIIDDKGKEIPSQLTHDSLILFACNVHVGETKKFRILKSDSIHSYKATVSGAFYPKRRDDLSYENELVGFRIYGPATQQAGEKAYGYDIFFKYPTEELIVPQLYEAQTSDTNWAKADSLRKIDKELADKFINSFTYHIDHGKGMDCYAVGPTLGAGVTAIFQNDSIIYPWCYESAEILDNGPLRFTAKLKFPTSFENITEGLTEYRILSLDSYSFLNDCRLWYEGLNTPVEIVSGFPLRDNSAPFVDKAKGILAYADPTQGNNNGKALLGLVTQKQADSVIFKDNHILLANQINPADTFKYKWGFTWDKTEIPTMEEWQDYLNISNLKYTVRIK